MLKKIQNVFSDEQVANLRDIIDNQKNTKEIFVWDENVDKTFPSEAFISGIVQNSSLGKIMINLNDLIPEDIKLALYDFASETDEPKVFHSATYTEYSLKYGTPNLNSHKDQLKDFWLVDYQLDANTDWDIYVEGETFTLKNNEAIAFHPGLLEHGRPQKIFSDGEFVSMIFFDMVAEKTKDKEL